jgi:hypothetical protein
LIKNAAVTDACLHQSRRSQLKLPENLRAGLYEKAMFKHNHA